jgi:hypothetical protein
MHIKNKDTFKKMTIAHFLQRQQCLKGYNLGRKAVKSSSLLASVF